MVDLTNPAVITNLACMFLVFPLGYVHRLITS